MALPPDDPPPGVPEWVVTYGDMMSLLLTFFIMLVSMAEMKNDGKMRQMLNSLQERFGPTDGRYGSPGPVFSDSGNNPHPGSSGMSSEGGTRKSGLDSGGLAGPSRTVKKLGHGTQITLGGAAVFDQFSAELNETARADLEMICKVIAPRPNRIVVRGHATREMLPKNSDFRDAVDLSFARAQAGAEFLIQYGIDPKRISVAAVGAGEPRSVSRDRKSQAQNRRIDVFVVDEYISPEKPKPNEDLMNMRSGMRAQRRSREGDSVRF